MVNVWPFARSDAFIAEDIIVIARQLPKSAPAHGIDRQAQGRIPSAKSDRIDVPIYARTSLCRTPSLADRDRRAERLDLWSRPAKPSTSMPIQIFSLGRSMTPRATRRHNACRIAFGLINAVAEMKASSFAAPIRISGKKPGDLSCGLLTNPANWPSRVSAIFQFISPRCRCRSGPASSNSPGDTETGRRPLSKRSLSGNNHLPDFIMAKPVFFEGRHRLLPPCGATTSMSGAVDPEAIRPPCRISTLKVFASRG